LHLTEKSAFISIQAVDAHCAVSICLLIAFAMTMFFFACVLSCGRPTSIDCWQAQVLVHEPFGSGGVAVTCSHECVVFGPPGGGSVQSIPNRLCIGRAPRSVWVVAT
jgi:hypothetical protein